MISDQCGPPRARHPPSNTFTITKGTHLLSRTNAEKDHDYGQENAVAPPRGANVSSHSPTVSASTTSELNASSKTSSLNRARSDASGQVMTTNQGVLIGDNQNSLKAGLRGPTLLEDFILREKITHFDHDRIRTCDAESRVMHLPRAQYLLLHALRHVNRNGKRQALKATGVGINLRVD